MLSVESKVGFCMHMFNYAFVCVFCSARRVECREGLSGSAGVLVRAAESGEGQPAGGKHHLSTDRKTDAAGQGGMFCFPFPILNTERCGLLCVDEHFPFLCARLNWTRRGVRQIPL